MIPSKHTLLIAKKLFNVLNGKIKTPSHRRLISNARYNVLTHLMMSGPQSVNDIASHRGVTAATMSRLVDNLVNDGFVIRANSKQDKRSKILLITNKGKAVIEAEDLRDMRTYEKAIAKLTKNEQMEFDKSMLLVNKFVTLVNADDK